MQKVIDWYFLIVSSVITIMSFCFCIQDNNWGNILLFCFSVMVSILYIINILKTSAFFSIVCSMCFCIIKCNNGNNFANFINDAYFQI